MSSSIAIAVFEEAGAISSGICLVSEERTIWIIEVLWMESNVQNSLIQRKWSKSSQETGAGRGSSRKRAPIKTLFREPIVPTD
jgi:hypothetical protein